MDTDAEADCRAATMTEFRQPTYPQRLRQFDPHPEEPGYRVIRDDLGETIVDGSCEWCGGQIMAGTWIRLLERECEGARSVSRFCVACSVAMADACWLGRFGDLETVNERRKLKSK